ncbi:MAG: hypothetical protein ACD_79C00925G0003 [uncultured bacterium]|nr:MAG: hypothetical protein ACD_79C00925G0003 [uncultured bacterium]
MKKNKKNKIKAFTLIELILTVSIFVVVASALYNFFYTGKKVYKRLEEFGKKNSEANNFYWIFKRDISNIVLWNNYTMALKAGEIYFHVLDNTSLGKVKRIDYVLRERYFESGKVKDVERIERTLPIQKEVNVKALQGVVLLKNCKTFNFKVLAKALLPEQETDEDKDEEVLKKDVQKVIELPEWEEKSFPLAVKLEIEQAEKPLEIFYEWFPRYQYEFPKDPMIKLSVEQFEKIKRGSYES